MAEFKAAYEKVFTNEGGYTTKPNETYCGIDRKWHPEWDGWPMIDKRNRSKKLKQNEVIDDPVLKGKVKMFFYVNFWQHIIGDRITSQRIATFVFDWLVTSWDEAIKAVQVVAGAKADGKFGLKTLEAINLLQDENKSVLRLKESRIAYYKSLKDPINERGWIKRVNTF